MKNRAIQERFAALSELSQRTLPSPAAINKVSVLLSWLKPPFEAFDSARKAVIRGVPIPPEWEDPQNPPLAIAEQRTAVVDAVLEESQPIRKIPDRFRLTSADMPRGDTNGAGVAGLRVMLGGLYLPSDDEKASADEQITDGEEE